MLTREEAADLADVYQALERWLREASRIRHARTLTILENRLERRMARFFRFQARNMARALAFEASLRAKRPQQEATTAPPASPGWPDWEDPWRRTVQLTSIGMRLALEEVLRDAMEAGILEANAELGTAFELGNPRAVEWLTRHAGEAIRGIDSTTRDDISRIVTDGVARGDSYASISRQITKALADYAAVAPDQAIRSRAHLIAVTETSSGYVQGNVMVGQTLQDQGLEMEKAWLTAEDDAVCPECAGDEDDGWIPFDGTFSGGDDEPPAHPGCRCDLLQRAAGTSSALDAGEEV